MTSYVDLPKEQVIEKCDEILTTIARHREEDKKTAIQNAVRRQNIIRKLFRMRQVTADEVRANGDWEEYSIHGWEAFQAAKRLRRAAELPYMRHERVHVSCEDIEKIWGYSP